MTESSLFATVSDPLVARGLHDASFRTIDCRDHRLLPSRRMQGNATPVARGVVVPSAGIEPATPGLGVRRSIP
jgi:hypothetical protein